MSKVTKKKVAKKPASKGNIAGVTDGAIKRMSYKAGVRKMSSECRPAVREYVDDLVGDLVKEAYVYMNTAGRTTLSQKDVINAINARGHQFAFSPSLAGQSAQCKTKVRKNTTKKRTTKKGRKSPAS